MKTPDKIYIPLYPNYNLDGVHLGDDWMYEPQKGCDNVTYIRKDALLEWVKLAYGKVSMNPFDCSEAFDELLYKIESL